MEPKEEYWPAGQLKHWLLVNIVCVDVKSVATSDAERTLLYMRKSLMPPFKYVSTFQLLFPKKLLDLDMARGYGFDASATT